MKQPNGLTVGAAADRSSPPSGVGLGSAEDMKEALAGRYTQADGPGKRPRSTSIHYDLDLPEGAEVTRKSVNQELVSSKGDVLNVEFRFALNGITMGEGQWTTVTEWLKELVILAVQNVQADSESLANVVAESYQPRASRPARETGLPAWAERGLVLEDITATVPYYPGAVTDVNGAATQRLQEKLIQLGYLTAAPTAFSAQRPRRPCSSWRNTCASWSRT